ncbi:Mobilization protein A [Neisseria subflava]|uniref:Mobilization protein A n=1 Tax=Neisseria subflava TaxID=28449 RepID=A0A9X9R084_NEISU|nr:MobA/MobL family protein [Neisseria subflava]VTY08876.1 Mobilization protein A [Neisseria subflava]
MAIYHLTAKTGSRNGGQSAKAKADYIQREGRYSRDRDEVLHTQSGHLPEWAERPADYWDAADLYERANGRLFKEVEFALPVELTLDQQRELVDEFARHLTEGERLPYKSGAYSLFQPMLPDLNPVVVLNDEHVCQIVLKFLIS